LRAPDAVYNYLPMGHRTPHELLEELCTYLKHFDQTGHLGESATVAEIKRRLRARIAEVESELKFAAQSKGLKINDPIE
jgi:hypothetical protein